ncbi:hypothetical protein CUJ83_03350 [Methanocella sp. CWC-04]|uniref:Oxidoreductase molybdopterin-binding domain-containing protein n=1 Tax=Methanooceanicella nereidis TaxID=2052831 RepID=A0AAP2W4A8_9EURY|nr:molybdopterin-dependent oxidoreductase [Methanocella sp. CWC-04]MCD1294030.1 hypothetical protein [Methanocella sp. CWC-04]
MNRKSIAIVIALVMLSAIALGCTDSTKNEALNFEVKGEVENPGAYNLEDYNDRLVTINAKLDGDVTHLPAQDYTGVPLRTVLADAKVKTGATMVSFLASDGYNQVFELSNVTANDNLILIDEDNTVRLVAKGYAGGMWVRYIKTIEIK